MRNSLLAATLIAFGTTVAVPATAAVKIERYAFEQPQMQKGDTLALLGVTGNGVTTGSTAGTETSVQYERLMNAVKASDQHHKVNAGEGVTTGATAGRPEAAPSETSGQHQPMKKDAGKKAVTTGSTAGTTKAAPYAGQHPFASSENKTFGSTAGTGPG